MTLRLLFPLALAASLAGCPAPTTPPTLDTSGVPGGTYGVDYEGALALTGYDGAAAFTINSGSLPQGLTMDAAGRITGTPSWVETQTVEVLVSGLDGVDDLVGDVTVSIDADGLDVELGYEHDQTNNMTELMGFMKNIWLRVDGSGTGEQQDWTMSPGLYLAGDDGVHEDGYGDDVRIGDIDFRELDWTFTNWVAPEARNTNQNYPSQHTNDGEPPSFTGRGVFSSHSDTGQADLTLKHPDYPNTIEVLVQVTPPDWCANGHSTGPQQGACE
jgi:hypothetical protein